MLERDDALRKKTTLLSQQSDLSSCTNVPAVPMDGIRKTLLGRPTFGVVASYFVSISESSCGWSSLAAGDHVIQGHWRRLVERQFLWSSQFRVWGAATLDSSVSGPRQRSFPVSDSPNLALGAIFREYLHRYLVTEPPSTSQNRSGGVLLVGIASGTSFEFATGTDGRAPGCLFGPDQFKRALAYLRDLLILMIVCRRIDAHGSTAGSLEAPTVSSFWRCVTDGEGSRWR
jgi:hypothetical protein